MRQRNRLLVVAAVVSMTAVAVLFGQKKAPLLVLDWSQRAGGEVLPASVLIEFGLKDKVPTDHSGHVTLSAAGLVSSEGYRFRTGDRLLKADNWEVSSHTPIRLPPRRPDLAKSEGVATVGVVLHLTQVRPNAELSIVPNNLDMKPQVVRLEDVLAGKPQPLWGGNAVVRRVSSASRVSDTGTEDDFPAAAHGPDGTLWLAYISYHLRDASRQIEKQPLAAQPENFKTYVTPEYADQLFVRYYRNKTWSDPIAFTGPKEDLVRCGLAVEADGTVWVAYSARRDGRTDVYARPLKVEFDPFGLPKAPPKPGAEQRLTTDATSNLTPVLVTGQGGEVHLAYQRWDREGKASIGRMVCRKGKWQAEPALAAKDANAWCPSLAAGPGGDVALATDVFRGGDYDVRVVVDSAAKEGADRPAPAFDGWAASSAKFEARPSACYDQQGGLWIAYEEGPDRWGQDFGALGPQKGHPLYDERSVRVVCLVDGKWHRPAAELPLSKNPRPTEEAGGHGWPMYEKAPRYSNPRLGLDGRGNLWLTYRQKFGNRYVSIPGSFWVTFAVRLEGDHWSDPIEVLHSDGLLDHRCVMLPHVSGGLLLLHNSDGRHVHPEAIQNRVHVNYIDLGGEAGAPRLEPITAAEKDLTAFRAEDEAVQRIRDYRIEAAGKKYQLLRGEFHRHTEISWDGGSDGSLEDMFRYAVDAAALDWIGNGDHDNGAGREYPWWLTQKWTDALHVADRFTPLFCYERSVPYPHGHRNCLFARRGVRTLPRLAEPDKEKQIAGIHADDTKMLYRYLHETGGICAVHTSATSMGTDWRDNDPDVEPLVEIYQGDRMSYEKQAAPRAGYDPKSDTKPANIAGWFPKGYVNLALEKGYRLGFQSSSDHWSTHISYAIFLSEKHDRESLLEAARQRHSYGATDNIILDVRSGQHLMGDAFKADGAAKLDIHVIGTAPLDRIEILQDSEVVQTLHADGKEYKGAWTAAKPAAGKHYYYVRVEQKDGQLAWSSPMWIESAK
jgi:hypothetical protein